MKTCITKNSRFNCNARHFFYLLLAWLCAPAWLSAQIESSKYYDREEDMLRQTNVAYLREKAQQDSIKYSIERDAAIRFARSFGYATEGSFKDKRYALQGFDDAGQLLYYASDNAVSAAVIRTSELHPGGEAGLDLTGAGSTMAIWEVGRPRLTHVEVNGRMTQFDNSTVAIDNHANHVCGTMIAAGVNSDAKGMAFEANLRVYDSNNDISEMTTAAASPNNIRLSNHSYGQISGWDYGDQSGQEGWHWWGNTAISQTIDYKFGLYDSKARDLDNIVFAAPFYLPVFAAGNDRNDIGPAAGAQHWVRNAAGQWISSTTTRQPDGVAGYDCIQPAQCAKNILTVGAIEAEVDGGLLITSMSTFSSWGPTDDGRVKPDVVARGVGVFSAFSTSNTAYGTLNGTSMAAPSVAGSMDLLLQHYTNLNPGFSIRASALKALVIHTTGRTDGPDYSTGWGLMDTRAAADFMTNSFDIESGDRLISRDTIFNSGTRNLTFYHDGSGPVRVTVAWTDPAGTVSTNTVNPTTARLVNDLDIRLIRVSDGTTYLPWRLNPNVPSASATKGDNFRDNVEQLYEEDLLPGQYTIRISHKGTLSGGFQIYSLMLSGRSEPVTCAGNTLLNNCSGTVTDGSGSNNYSNNLDCSWTISPPNANSVTLTFTSFNTEDFEFVEVYNGTSENDPLLGSFEGTSLPPVLTANSGSMYITFKTDGSVTAPGWSANYACSTFTPQLSLNPSSLNFGAGSGSNTFVLNANCAWTIQNIPSWLTLSPTSGSVTTLIGVSCTANNSIQTRTATITVTACNGLSQTLTITQSGCTAPTAPTITATGSTSLCSGQSVTLTATNICSGCSVAWSNGQTGASTTVSTAGTYSATYNNPCGTSQSSASIGVTAGTAPTMPTITASGSTSLCPGQSVTLTATDICSGCSVTWSNGQTGASTTVSATGTYSATYSNACGTSQSSASIGVTAGTTPTAPTITASGSTSLCPGQSVTLTATNICSGCSVAWSNGQTGASTTVSATGTYSATYSNACGTSQASASIGVTAGTAPTAPTITASGSTSLCSGESVTLTATNICSGCSVAWSNGQTGASTTVSASGTYSATYSNPCGTSQASASIGVTAGTAPTAPTITASGSTSLCPGESVTLTATDICSGCSVAWSNGQTGASTTVSATGTYSATYSNICGTSQSSASIGVTAGTALTAPTITASGSTSLCPGESVTLTATNICSGCSVAWSNGQTGTSTTVSATGTYSATYSNACGTSQTSASIGVTAGTAPTAPTITASGSMSLCPGQSVTLTATNICSGCLVAWSNGQMGASTTVSSAGTYTALYSNTCGVGAVSNLLTVTTNPIFTPLVQVNNLCYLAAPMGSGFQWSLNGIAILGANSQFWVAQEDGYYTVAMVNLDGCPGISSPVFAESCVSATTETPLLPSVQLYPNPAQDRVVLAVQSATTLSAVRLEIFGADGRAIGELFHGDLLSGEQKIAIALPDWPNGLYMYRLLTERGSLYGSLIILH